MSACNTAFFRGNRHHVLLGRYLVSGIRCRRSVTASFPPPLAGPAHSTQIGGQCTELVWGVVGFKQSLNCATSTTVLSPSCPLPRPLALFLTPSLSFSSALSLSLTFSPFSSPPPPGRCHSLKRLVAWMSVNFPVARPFLAHHPGWAGPSAARYFVALVASTVAAAAAMDCMQFVQDSG